MLFRSDTDDYTDNISIHSSSSTVNDVMSADGECGNKDYVLTSEKDGWQHVTIPKETPISSDGDYEVITTSGFSATVQIEPTLEMHQDERESRQETEGSNLSRVKEWNRQRNQQRNQLGLSINKTFTELSREDPDQMEEEAIQRAIELSMLDVAIVYQYQRPTTFPEQQHQRILPHIILGVAENADATEIKKAYRKLARLHVSFYYV